MGKPTEKKIKEINLYTGGSIGVYVNKQGQFTLPNTFVSKSGEYIGEFSKAEWYIKNNMIVNNKRPNGLATVLKKPAKDLFPQGIPALIPDKYIKAYCGYSHRMAVPFKIGNKLFDEKWTGRHTWEEIENMPFIKRGSKTITNLKECERAAINFSKYVG